MPINNKINPFRSSTILYKRSHFEDDYLRLYLKNRGHRETGAKLISGVP
ncbi:hypothetical protein CWATWH8502_1278 [Crocosphaera watsonii WH 8502]|uniref:Uncharacterized protein n=5 Tax=Crocosphaera watsonii TaxID=263511 RepID=T2K0D4_CROWT|nr:hypothetical protein CWATWH0003_2826 [Crocosphaera watsonii WH 0003]CCQ50036.1 hypothetical protein CWATWH8502_1278 [Crocosphaera watsonii WH 8502]CCQ54916.1 hypothetical protein CWATWH0005_2713 [Crocosphaera watsonii WH 0005]CCQ63988.1 hypothetical protein CWATWH0401_3860 [Crocosphaera watsonii WH 0401]CCQ70846.1 hypothetical protein CWATWH0402_122 [Crocosphaera watsonii WH 0402]